jgi:hypothetical protein
MRRIFVIILAKIPLKAGNFLRFFVDLPLKTVYHSVTFADLVLWKFALFLGFGRKTIGLNPQKRRDLTKVVSVARQL